MKLTAKYDSAIQAVEAELKRIDADARTEAQSQTNARRKRLRAKLDALEGAAREEAEAEIRRIEDEAFEAALAKREKGRDRFEARLKSLAASPVVEFEVPDGASVAQNVGVAIGTVFGRPELPADCDVEVVAPGGGCSIFVGVSPAVPSWTSAIR